MVVLMWRNDHAGAPLLHEHVDPEATDFRRVDGEVGLVRGGELGLLRSRHQRFGEHRAVGWRQRLLGDRADLAVQLDRGRKTGGQNRSDALRATMKRNHS
jgi:hypothetical protein